jgi:hypothetical protein
MSLRNVMGWFNQVPLVPRFVGRGKNRREIEYTGPQKAAILLKDGSLVHIDFTVRSDRERASATFNEYVGHVTLIPATGKWSGEGPNPAQPEWTVRVSDLDTAEEAAMALRFKIDQEQRAEEAIQADPAAYLEREMRAHDWTAAFSDAYGVCAAADRHWSFIQTLRAKVAPEVYDAIAAKYNPWVAV